MGHFVEAAVSHHAATGRREPLDAALRVASHVAAAFGPGRDERVDAHPEIELALCRLAAATGERRLEALRERQRTEGMGLIDFRIERDGNGRDFDVVPSFAGAFAQGHRLRLEAVGAGPAGRDALLHESGYYVDATSALRIFLPRSDVRAAIAGFAPGRPYRVRATLALDVGSGGPAGYWSDAFLESVFPARDRAHSLEREIRFEDVLPLPR